MIFARLSTTRDVRSFAKFVLLQIDISHKSCYTYPVFKQTDFITDHYMNGKEIVTAPATAVAEYFMMKKYTYRTKGTCSTQIELELDGNVVHNVKFTGGCDGNLKAIPRLVEGMTVEEVEKRLSGIRCGFKNTSCGDQLVKACQAALAENA